MTKHAMTDALDLAFIDRLWADWSPGYDASEDLPLVKACLGDPANLAAAVGYYRAIFGNGPTDPELAGEQAAVSLTAPQPLLYLHGADDGCMGADIVDASVATETVIVDKSGHFLHLEQPDEVNTRILDFVTP